MGTMFEQLKYYYPVFIPIFLAFLTVLHRIAMERDRSSLSSLWKIYTDLTLGLFAFILWAYGSPSFRTGRVALNPDYYLDAEFINLLLLFDIGLLVMGIFVARHEWPQPKYARFADGLMILAALFFVTIPLQIKKHEDMQAQRAEGRAARTYDVGIPYHDPSFEKHVGTQRWGDRSLFTRIANVEAQSESDALEKALVEFGKLSQAFRMYPKLTYGDGRVLADRGKAIVIQNRTSQWATRGPDNPW